MTQRTRGETLAISDSVAMTPIVQPAAAGTQEKRAVGRVWVRPVRLRTVICPEDRPSTWKIDGTWTAPDRSRHSPDRARVFLTRAFAGFVRYRAGFAERQLQALEPVAHRSGVR